MKSHEYYTLQRSRHGHANMPWRKYAEWIILHDPLWLASAPANVTRSLTPRQAFSIMLRKSDTFSDCDIIAYAFGGTRSDLIQSLQSLWNCSGIRRVTAEMLRTVPPLWINSPEDSRLLLAWLIFQDGTNTAYRIAYRNANEHAAPKIQMSAGRDMTAFSAISALMLENSELLLYGFVFVFYGAFAFFTSKLL